MSSPRDLALSLLAAANNHGDLAIKLSSLQQVKEILLVSDPSLSAELFPYLADLHSSPDALVRNTLIQVMEEAGMKAVEHLSILMPAMLNLVKDIDPVVARQSIITGTNLFGYVLEEMALQFHHHGGVEKWLEELWAWMRRFKDAVFVIALEPGLVRIKLLALKFMETCVLLFTSDSNDDKKPVSKVTQRTSRTSNIPKLCDGHPILDPMTLSAEANRIFGILLNFLRPASSLPGPLTIAVVNWTENATGLIYSTEYISDYLWHCIVSLVTIARKRPIYYGTVLTTLQNFDLNSMMTNGAHAASIHYSLRTAFLGFLRSTQPAFLESRDRLIKALRAANAGDAADQVVRQVDKMIKNNERALRESHKADQYSTNLPMSNDISRKRSLNQEYEDSTNSTETKIGRYAFESQLAPSVQKDNYDQHSVSVNGAPPIAPIIHVNLTPVEQMVAMICALLAEGDRGAESLDILISNIHPDLLADIVINNMKHLPKALPDVTRLTKLSVGHQVGSLHNLSQTAPTDSPTYPVPSSQVHVPSPSAVITPPIDLLTPTNAPIEFRRDQRRDLRRMDPRRVADPIKSSISTSEEISIKFESGISLNSVKDYLAPEMKSNDTLSTENPLGSKLDDIENMVATEVENSIPEGITDVVGDMHVDGTSDVDLCQDSELHKAPVRPFYFFLEDEDEGTPNSIDVDQHSAPVCDASVSEKEPRDLPSVPSHVDLTVSQQRSLSISAFQRIFDLYKHLREPVFCEIRMSLIARLVAQSDGDSDLLAMLQKHLSSDYQSKKGHDLILNILDHLHTLMTSDVSDCSSSAAVLYEKILLTMANVLLESLPASDKAFSRLFGEVPSLPDSAMKLLDDLCCSTMMDQGRAVARDGDRVTQGLGVVWSLILGRPQYREACLNIALKCAVHLQDDVRAKAIRLVANKLYPLNYISAKIEEFASKMLVSAVDQHIVDNDISNAELKIEGEDGSQEASAIESPIPQSIKSEYDSVTATQQSAAGASAQSVPGAQHFVSLYFALCTKNPSLSKFIFDTYGRSSKSVKQAINRHIPVLIRSLGSTCSELLHILSDPPQGCENLISIVLQSLTEETAPSPELIATVKLLYETKLKDASILIPVLSSLSKNEVLPIFPRLVNLPLDKFKTALAYILQGSAHTGPALTPAEVLVAIHDIVPEKDSIPLKKITDACSACFEQRIVFTQQVLEKALNQMVDQTPLPLLFMRTVIQAIDAFPSLVDCVMEILSKLVSKQVWRMPKLWFGFLKCISQTQPHSFPVLLQLPSPQLEIALSKYATLRSLLVNYASQPSVNQSLPRSTLAVLGLANESQMQHTPSLAPTDTNSSVHGATLT